MSVRAVFSDKPAENAKQPDTPISSTFDLVISHGGQLKEAISVRCYYSPRGSGLQPVRACIWVRPAEHGAQWRSGRGSAGGCGYHKESAAIADAVRSAGVSLFGRAPWHSAKQKGDSRRPFDFGGTGSSAYEPVFLAIAKAAGYRIRKGGYLLVSH